MICGKSKELKRSLIAKFKSNENVLILGYTKRMNEWMASSQLMITKPGGITITEGFTELYSNDFPKSCTWSRA